MRPRFYAGLTACLILLFALTITACRKSRINAVDNPLELPAAGSAVTNAANQFAWNIFRQVLNVEPSGTNNLISPLSIYLALSMTYNGAANATADSMAATLRLQGISIDQLNAVSKALIQQMPKEDNMVRIALANSIWYNKSNPQPAAAFQDTVSTDYLSTIQGLDFTSSSAVNTINSWVAKNTNNKIPTIIQSLSAQDIMVLVNAIYFNGGWMHSFDASKTKSAPFYLANGSTVNTPFMNQTQSLPFFAGNDYTIADIPYGTGKGFDMIVIQPKDQTVPIADFAQGYNSSSIPTPSMPMDTVTVDLSLPKWTYSYTVDNMAQELSNLGMGIAFGDADFSKMYSGVSTHISKVVHKAFIDVSEQGTEAAAATAVVTTTAICANCNRWELNLNHPFIYLITEKQTGLILFMGVITDPSQH